MFKRLISIILTAILMFGVSGCGMIAVQKETVNDAVQEEKTVIRIGAMSGPTAMGMVKLRRDAESGGTDNEYEFQDFASDASAFVTPLATGDIDIAAVPSNLAANIYNKTEGKVSVLAVKIKPLPLVLEFSLS